MGYFKTKAIIFDARPTGEHDKYLEMILEDGRRLSAKIRKARHTKSKWGSRTEPATIAELELYEKQNRYTVTGITSANSFSEVFKSYDKAVGARYLAEIISGTTPYDVPEHGTFEITTNIFASLSKSENILVVINKFLARIIQSAGYSIELDYCMVCGDVVEGDCMFSLKEGSVICLGCTSSKMVKLPNFARLALRNICDDKDCEDSKKLSLGIHTLLERIVEFHFSFKARSSLHLRGL